MNGRKPPPRVLPSAWSLHRLHSYDQERLAEVGRINLILYKPRSFNLQRRYQRSGEWLQQCFHPPKLQQQTKELIEYYRYYKNSPLITSMKLMDLMIGYWKRNKHLYYRRIKKQLQFEDDHSLATQANIQPTGKSVTNSHFFELPSHLRSIDLTTLDDPDATLKYLLTTITQHPQPKLETRAVSRRIGQFQQRTTKTTKKAHLRTNPSNIGSTSSFKKSYKQSKHKSLSNQKKKSPTHGKKLNSNASCQRLNSKLKYETLNYQRRHRQPKHQKKHKDNFLHPKIREVSVGKKDEKSEGKSSKKKLSQRKLRQAENIKVKTAISKARDKIKAEKNVAIKKYIQQRQSLSRSSDSWQQDLKKGKK